MGLEVAAIMAATQVAGTVIGVAGIGASIYGAQKTHEASVKAEGLRKRQMELENSRQQREIIRRAQVSQSNALVNTTSAGAASEGSSALPGGYGQIQSHMNQQILGSEQNLDIGRGLFQANVEEADARMFSSIGKGAQDLGGTLIQRSDIIGRLFGDANTSNTGKTGSRSNPFV